MTGVEFRLLGPVEVRTEGGVLPLGGRRDHSLIAALLLEANRVVPLDSLVAAAWGDEPPATAQVQARNRVAAIRRRLPVRDGTGMIVTHSSGYLINVDADQLDTHRFRHLVVRADHLARASEPGRAAEVLAEALRLWRGPALEGLRTPALAAAARQLEEARATALERRVELGLAAGRHRELLADLSALTESYPYRERLREYFMLALYRAGRRAEALAVFRQTRTLLADQLGVEPGPELQRLHEAMLRGDESLASLPRARVRMAAGVPRQLPRDVFGFAGRVQEIGWLDALVDAPAGVGLVVGSAGVGKTALAVHWAHRVADRFPSGQLYVNLRGFDLGAAMTPAEAVRGFLDALGVPAESVPASFEAQVGRYRTLLADQRVLVVLDNARDAEQVRPLLPGSPGSLALVTSRNQLSGLVATAGARPLRVGLLNQDESRQMLAVRLGGQRVAAEPVAVDDIITSSARLALALAIVAARAASQPEFSLRVLADELSRGRRGLGALDGDDGATDVRTVFSWSYQALSVPAARLFRLLGLHPGPDISIPAAASLAELPLDEARALLAELVRAHLIEERTPSRYWFHDLLRAYADELAHAADTEADRRGAVHRMVDQYARAAVEAALAINPYRDPHPEQAFVAGETDAGLTNQQAMSWFAAEHRVLVALVKQAAVCGFDHHVCRLVWALVDFLDRCGQWTSWADVQQDAVHAAKRIGDVRWEANNRYDLARAYTKLGRLDEARELLHQAEKRFRRLGDEAGCARTSLRLCFAMGRDGRHEEALQYAQEAFARYRSAGNTTGQADALNAVGWHHAHLGNYARALVDCQQALDLHRMVGDQRGQAASWDSLGYVYRQTSDFTSAVMCYQHAANLRREVGSRHLEAASLNRLGDAHLATGDHEAAGDAWRQALDILNALGHPNVAEIQAKVDGRISARGLG